MTEVLFGRREMKQISFAEAEFSGKKRVTRRERFLREIERVVPWPKLIAVIAPHYTKGGKTGRPPIPLERLLRMYLVQQCFALSDEDALYDSQSIRDFVGLDLARERAPDATTLLHFRHLLEKHQLTAGLFAAINAHLAEKGLILREGTIVDATLIAAPSSTKNQEGKRDPEMHQTKKGKQWHFGMKAHIGVDASSGIIHTVVTTPANDHDVTQAGNLLHGKEKSVFGDAGYQGVEKRDENKDRKINWHVAMRPGKRRALPDDEIGRIDEAIEKLKAKVRAKVEHPFHLLKNRLGMKKTRYRGLMKNTAQLFTLFGIANLLIAKRKLFALDEGGAS